jgi:hypothetical protein
MMGRWGGERLIVNCKRLRRKKEKPIVCSIIPKQVEKENIKKTETLIQL